LSGFAPLGNSQGPTFWVSFGGSDPRRLRAARILFLPRSGLEGDVTSPLCDFPIPGLQSPENFPVVRIFFLLDSRRGAPGPRGETLECRPEGFTFLCPLSLEFQCWQLRSSGFFPILLWKKKQPPHFPSSLTPWRGFTLGFFLHLLVSLSHSTFLAVPPGPPPFPVPPQRGSDHCPSFVFPPWSWWWGLYLSLLRPARTLRPQSPPSTTLEERVSPAALDTH